MIEMHHLRHFVAAVEKTHFLRAELHLGIEQSSLARSFRNLEAPIVIRLFQPDIHRT